MPDITMCPGRSCPQKESCYRFKAKPDEYRQSYFTVEPWITSGGFVCEYYVDMPEVNSKSRIKRINIQNENI